MHHWMAGHYPFVILRLHLWLKRLGPEWHHRVHKGTIVSKRLV
jgi:hypothetical protein